QGRLGDAVPVPPVLLGSRDAEPAGFGERVVELVRELVCRVRLHPVLVVELGCQLGDRLPDGLLVLGELEVHGCARPPRLRPPRRKRRLIKWLDQTNFRRAVGCLPTGRSTPLEIRTGTRRAGRACRTGADRAPTCNRSHRGW